MMRVAECLSAPLVRGLDNPRNSHATERQRHQVLALVRRAAVLRVPPPGEGPVAHP